MAYPYNKIPDDKGIHTEYPPRPTFIAKEYMYLLFLVIPIAIFCLFLRGNVGWILSVLIISTWFLWSVKKTDQRWKALCDSGFVFLEVDNEYLLSHWFFCDIRNHMLYKITEQDISELKQYLQKRKKEFRADSMYQPQDDNHWYYDRKYKIWITYNEYLERTTAYRNIRNNERLTPEEKQKQMQEWDDHQIEEILKNLK